VYIYYVFNELFIRAFERAESGAHGPLKANN